MMKFVWPCDLYCLEELLFEPIGLNIAERKINYINWGRHSYLLSAFKILFDGDMSKTASTYATELNNYTHHILLIIF